MYYQKDSGTAGTYSNSDYRYRIYRNVTTESSLITEEEIKQLEENEYEENEDYPENKIKILVSQNELRKPFPFRTDRLIGKREKRIGLKR